MKRALLLLLLISANCFPCTSAIISGKVTIDGRPLLWKHRDSDFDENKLMFFHGPKYDFTAVVNSNDKEGKEVWMGSNSAGFSIINTMSYNLEDNKSCRSMDHEGELMKYALGRCSTVDEFERLLIKEKGKWGVATNLGVIDAVGGAAYFEVDCSSVVKYDVNDTTIAPHGYLIRTNYSFSGKKDGLGYFRYETARSIFTNAFNNHELSVKFLLKNADRNLQNSVLNNNLYLSLLPEDTSSIVFIPFRDYIVRYSTTSSMIIQGVKKGEDPNLTTLWVVLGWPLTTVVTPVWVATGETLPKVTLTNGNGTALINKKSLSLKSKCFPIKHDNGKDYLNLSMVLNNKGTGIAQILLPYEDDILGKTNTVIEKWRKNKFERTEAIDFYNWLDDYIIRIYKEKFGL